MEAELAAAQSEYPAHALAARVAAAATERAQQLAKADECTQTIARTRAAIKPLMPMLEAARTAAAAEAQASARDRIGASIRSIAAGLERRRAAASRAEELLSELAAALREVRQHGREAHGQLRRFVSVDQAWISDPNEDALAQSLLGMLIQRGSLSVDALLAVSAAGLRYAHQNETLTQLVSAQNALMLSRFDPALLAPEAAPKKPQRAAHGRAARKDFFANARLSEPVPSGPIDYAPVARLPGGIEATDGVALAMSAAAKAGIGVTAFAGIWNAWIDAERQPIATTAQAAKAALVDAYGDQADGKLAIAKQFVDGISDRWPGFKDVLQRTHLGNSPDFVKAIIRIAEQRRR